MKIGIWLYKDLLQERGGAYSYYNALISEVDKYQFNNCIEIVFIKPFQEKVDIVTNKTIITLNNPTRKNSFFRNIFNLAVIKLPILGNKFANRTRLKTKINKSNHWISQLNEHLVKVIYYPIQANCEIPDFPFIATNWDIGHKSTYAFPELTNHNEFEYRNNWYNNILPRALSVFCESEAGKKELSNYINIFEQKLKTLPLFPGNLSKIQTTEKENIEVLNKYTLEKHKYFVYPAQFWSHKNHFNLLKAFLKTVNYSPHIKLVLCGSTKLSIKHLTEFIENNGITNHVLFTGFVSDKEVSIFYKNAAALVMPTFLGPTNMPLLEARESECPVLCSNLIGHKELMGNGALYFNPTDDTEMSEQMKKILNPKIRNTILEQAKVEADQSIFNLPSATKLLEKNLIEIKKQRDCWI